MLMVQLGSGMQAVTVCRPYVGLEHKNFLKRSVLNKISFKDLN